MTRSTRRSFLAWTMASGMATILPRLLYAAPAEKQLRILILGGTAMLGPAIVDAALARGHKVTTFNRGKTEKVRGVVVPAGVEQLVGDRDPKMDGGLKALDGRTFEVVIDTSGLFPRHVDASASMLKKQGTRQYIFISSISVYANHKTPNANEGDELVVPEKPNAEEGDPGFVYTGELKRPCEQAAEKHFGKNVTIVRPCYIVGPGDATGRFAYWPIRVSEATDEHVEMLVPGSPEDPMQIIDVRDLAAWLIRLGEESIGGTFNACGPSQKFGDILRACEDATGKKPRYSWASWAFLIQRQISMPIALPPKGEYAGFHRRVGERALEAGLTLRPIRETVDGILAWWGSQPPESKAKLRGGISLAFEAEMLAAWKKSQ